MVKPTHFVCKIENLINRIASIHPLGTHNTLVVSIALFIDQKYRQSMIVTSFYRLGTEAEAG